MVSNICIYGEASRSFVVALVCPVPEKLRALAERLPNKADMEFEALCKVDTRPVLNKLILTCSLRRQKVVFPDP